VKTARVSPQAPAEGTLGDALPLAVAPLIETRGVCKWFGAVKAVTDVDISFWPGEVHGLVGANGAGKTTLLNVICGVVQPSSGSVSVEGVETHIRRPRDAAALGFSSIPQELLLVPQFSAADNMTLGLRSGTRYGFVDDRTRWKIARTVADRLEMMFDVRTPVRLLTVAERGLVAIGRALARDARFIAMDEPTSSLSAVECERLFQVVRELTKDGVSVAYVSHRLDEIEELSDRVAVFRNGRITARFERGSYTHHEMFESITGSAKETIRGVPGSRGHGSREVVFCAEHVADGHRVKDVSFDCRAGEIVGLGGVVGSGRTETLKLAFGEGRLVSGAMKIGGHPYRPASVRDAVDGGVGLVPEERRSEGLLMADTIVANIALGNWSAMRTRPGLPYCSDRRAREVASSMMSGLGIRAKAATEGVMTLSGGNQQKVVFARWLARDTRLLLLDEPTRGVDVGARQQIWGTVEELASHDKGVIVVSSELGELAVCSRVFVIVEGRTVAELPGPGVTEDQILSVIYSQPIEREA
jgi:ribose transport system ATP-binding protein